MNVTYYLYPKVEGTRLGPQTSEWKILKGDIYLFLHYQERTFYHVFQADKAHILNTSNMKDEEPTTLTYQGFHVPNDNG